MVLSLHLVWAIEQGDFIIRQIHTVILNIVMSTRKEVGNNSDDDERGPR